MLKRLFVVLAMTVGSAGLDAQNRPLQIATEPGSTTYLVFFRQRPVGREEVTVVRNAEGWTVRGTSQLGGPIDITTRRAEVRYDVDWKPRSLIVDSIAGGQDMQLRTTFANGIASNELVTQGNDHLQGHPGLGGRRGAAEHVPRLIRSARTPAAGPEAGRGTARLHRAPD